MSKMGRHVVNLQINRDGASDWDVATSMEAWDATLGKCVALLWEVVSASEHRDDLSAWSLVFNAEQWAVQVLIRQAPLTLARAYEEIDYPPPTNLEF